MERRHRDDAAGDADVITVWQRRVARGVNVCAVEAFTSGAEVMNRVLVAGLRGGVPKRETARAECSKRVCCAGNAARARRRRRADRGAGF